MERKYIDLHTHSTYSDGDLPPKENLKLAVLNGLDIFTVSDHDNYRAYLEIKDLAKSLPITLIPGTEFTGEKYHLLGLNYNPFNKGFQNFVEYSRRVQEKECERRIETLREEGLPINLEKVKKIYPVSRLGKGNLMRIIMSDKDCRNYVNKEHNRKTTREIYDYYVGKEGIISNLDERQGIREEEIISQVHKYGGIVGVAHIPKQANTIEELGELIEMGIDFMEVQPRLVSQYPYQKFIDYAIKIGLPLSYGSDYHGPSLVKRTMLSREKNVLHKDMQEILNKGFIKIS